MNQIPYPEGHSLVEGDTSFGTAPPGAVESEFVILKISLESNDEDAIPPE